jgi:hypothetical protein
MASKADFNAEAIEVTLHKGISRGLNLITLSLQRRIKNKLSKPGSGRIYKYGKGNKKRHQASAKGEPPATRSGNLINSWTVAAKVSKPRMHGPEMKMTYGPGRIGGAAKYAWALEYGHVYSNRVLHERPYVRPSIERLERGGRAQKIMTGQLERAVAQANRRVN